MPEILNFSKDMLEYASSYLDKRYFLWLMGSIFLLGIVGQWITGAVYRNLIKKAENMVSTKNKMLKQIKMKFENCKAVNGVVANPTLMVERYINKYRFMGITLGGLSRITNICAVLCLAIGGVTGIALYELEYDSATISFYVLTGCFLAFALDIYARSVRIDLKEGELVCIITDFLENTLNCKERRLERTAETLRMMEEREEKEVNPEDKFIVNYEPEVIHKSLDEETYRKSDMDALREQEYIINEVLGEFL